MIPDTPVSKAKIGSADLLNCVNSLTLAPAQTPGLGDQSQIGFLSGERLVRCFNQACFAWKIGSVGGTWDFVGNYVHGVRQGAAVANFDDFAFVSGGTPSNWGRRDLFLS